jgi:hypothetical protein
MGDPPNKWVMRVIVIRGLAYLCINHELAAAFVVFEG